MRHSTRFGLAALIVLGITSVGHTIPQLINYQGVLTEAGGTPITVATTVEFRIWDMDSGGMELWMESQSVTPNADGLFSVLLGSVNPVPDSALAAAAAYLGLTILPDAEMSPRTQLVSMAYAYRVSSIAGASAGDLRGNLVLKPIEGALKTSQSADDPQITLITSAGDSIIIGPADEKVFRAVDVLNGEYMQAVYDPITGPLFSIRVDGTEKADHTATVSSYSTGDASKGVDAFTKNMQVGRDGLALFGASEADTLVNLSEVSDGMPELRLTNFSTAAKAGVIGRTLRLGGLSPNGDVLFSIEDPDGSILMETVVDGSGVTRQIYYDAPTAKNNFATGVKRVEFTRDGAIMYDDAGNVRVAMGVSETGDGRISFYEGVAKSIAVASQKIQIDKGGISIFGATVADTVLRLFPDGDISSVGQIAVGIGATGADQSTVFGFNNTASGDSSVVSGGYDNVASGDVAVIGGGRNNLASANERSAVDLTTPQADLSAQLPVGKITQQPAPDLPLAVDSTTGPLQIMAPSAVDKTTVRATPIPQLEADSSMLQVPYGLQSAAAAVIPPVPPTRPSEVERTTKPVAATLLFLAVV